MDCTGGRPGPIPASHATGGTLVARLPARGPANRAEMPSARSARPVDKGECMMAKIEKSIDVDVPQRTAYNQWTQFEEFPRFMEGVREVEQLDDQRLHWRAEVGGQEEEWDALI